MKSIAAALLLCVGLVPAGRQYPPIGVIDFYGLRRLGERQVREALGIKEGDPAPGEDDPVREEVMRRLRGLPGARDARLSFVCCEAGKSILYVGVAEAGGPTLTFRPAPRGSVRLPEEMTRAGRALAEAVERAVERGDNAEDDSEGHALFHDPEARAIQERFKTFAARDLKRLRAVLRGSADPEQRALAAEIIAYAPDKREVVADLVYGVHDPDGGVRNDSMRALGVIAWFASRQPGRRIRVPARPFVEMLNSVVWTDRNKSAGALMRLTEKRDPALLESLRRGALPSLIEMARWKHAGHAQPPFFILGRVGRVLEAEIWRAWQGGDREALIRRVLKNLRAGVSRRRARRRC